jgi:hypothetical protein
MGRGSAEVPSAAKPLRAGLTVRRSRQQTRASLKVAVRLMGAGHTEWIGNDKSASRSMTTSEVDSRARCDRVRQSDGTGFAERSGMIMIVNITRTIRPLGG